MVYTPTFAGETLTAAKFNSLLIEETMPWTDFAAIGSFASGFSAASYTPRMRKLRILGQERWEYEGRLAVTSGTIVANVNTTAFTFNVGFRPAFEHGWQVTGGSTGFFGVRAAISTGGLLQVGVPTGAGNTTNGVLLDGLFIDAPI
ncbi:MULTISPECIES: hypothetical protein [Streptomyces]|uniref:Uncharacterized protein n=2 Tax=root TaxID=1 RepID=F2R6B2_STRVP|nr:hypothetical protein [Streptomyces venezuelae]YP_010754231.1 hypothetical protein QEH31_gp19 [Streptomyces phage Chymera]AMS01578.1 hypothetical protein SEA_CHYMERA_19 [Streptomyces phage Chymera]APE22048.1 hypothetical protein vnz_14150 [Streptomyces venezuelae]QER99436.1 hypothetical protein DEJ43_14325 [Streptomyces venezuelae ATCC 10712]CCA56163.1 hypothetical protein SVEN_2877 [Streptomyces venezuelae ATCC 10712]